MAHTTNIWLRFSSRSFSLCFYCCCFWCYYTHFRGVYGSRLQYIKYEHFMYKFVYWMSIYFVHIVYRTAMDTESVCVYRRLLLHRAHCAEGHREQRAARWRASAREWMSSLMLVFRLLRPTTNHEATRISIGVSPFLTVFFFCVFLVLSLFVPLLRFPDVCVCDDLSLFSSSSSSSSRIFFVVYMYVLFKCSLWIFLSYVTIRLFSHTHTQKKICDKYTHTHSPEIGTPMKFYITKKKY